MSKYKLSIIFLILFFELGNGLVLCQDRFKIGFNLQAEKVFYNSKYETGINFPTINTLIKYKFSENYFLEFNAGYKLPAFDWVLFNGPEAGITIDRKIFEKWLYGKLNFTLHFNKGGGHVSMSGGDGAYINTIPLVGAGIDLYTSNNFCFNFIFFKLLKEKIGYSYSYSELGVYQIDYEYKLTYFIRFGFSLYWNIL